jgi:hypothetical protein
VQPALANARGCALAGLDIGGREVVQERRAQPPRVLLQVTRVDALLVAAPIQISALGPTAGVARGARGDLPCSPLGLRACRRVGGESTGQRGAQRDAHWRITITASHELERVQGREIAPQLLGQRPREAGVAVGDRRRQVRHAGPDLALVVARAQVAPAKHGAQHPLSMLAGLTHARARRTLSAWRRLVTELLERPAHSRGHRRQLGHAQRAPLVAGAEARRAPQPRVHHRVGERLDVKPAKELLLRVRAVLADRAARRIQEDLLLRTHQSREGSVTTWRINDDAD